MDSNMVANLCKTDLTKNTRWACWFISNWDPDLPHPTHARIHNCESAPCKTLHLAAIYSAESRNDSTVKQAGIIQKACLLSFKSVCCS